MDVHAPLSSGGFVFGASPLAVARASVPRPRGTPVRRRAGSRGGRALPEGVARRMCAGLRSPSRSGKARALRETPSGTGSARAGAGFAVCVRAGDDKKNSPPGALCVRAVRGRAGRAGIQGRGTWGYNAQQQRQSVARGWAMEFFVRTGFRRGDRE